LKISGTSTVPAPQEQAYALLQDPGVLARCMPGCEGLDKIGEGEYALRLKMSLASMSGLFQGKVRVAEQNPFSSFRLIVEGSGKIGFMKGDGVLTLTPASPDTTVQFDGDVQVGGTIASVGQRLIETTAKMLIKRFFVKLTAEVTEPRP
jgi:carbon monoxide dehydrogenase subunit G